VVRALDSRLDDHEFDSQLLQLLLGWVTIFGRTNRLSLSPSHLGQTQPPVLSGTRNEYQPKCVDALWLGSKGRYGSFHLWINVWVTGKTV